MHACTHACTLAPTHPPTHPPTHSLTHSLSHSLKHTEHVIVTLIALPHTFNSVCLQYRIIQSWLLLQPFSQHCWCCHWIYLMLHWSCKLKEFVRLVNWTCVEEPFSHNLLRPFQINSLFPVFLSDTFLHAGGQSVSIILWAFQAIIYPVTTIENNLLAF